MATSHAARARLIPGAAAVVLAAGLAVSLAGDDGRLGPVVAVLAWAGLAATAVGVLGAWAPPGIVAALLLGAAFCATRYDAEGTLDARVVPLAAGLLLLAELVGWSAEARTAAPPGVPASARLTVLGLAVLTGGGAAALVAAAVTAPVGDDLALAALGAAAVVLVAVLGLGLARTPEG